MLALVIRWRYTIGSAINPNRIVSQSLQVQGMFTFFVHQKFLKLYENLIAIWTMNNPLCALWIAVVGLDSIDRSMCTSCTEPLTTSTAMGPVVVLY